MTSTPTNADIYLKLGELAGAVRAIDDKLDGHQARMDGHGTRLNALEQEQARAGAQRNMTAALMGSFAAACVTFVVALVKGALGKS